MRNLLYLIAFCLLHLLVSAQQGFQWSPDGKGYFQLEKNELAFYQLPQQSRKLVVAAASLVPAGANQPVSISAYQFSTDRKKLLVFTNTKKVWRYETRGDYFLLDTETGSLKKLGQSLPPSSLMFAKFSPDGKKVAYVSQYNLYAEDLGTGKITQLTTDGSRKRINGTFDWAYEEEFFCRDGFRWSPDSRNIAFWQIIAENTKDYLMINNTDSIYPKAIPVEYPVAGEKPSAFRIGVVNTESKSINWMKIPDDPILGSYVPRMEWAASDNEIIIQHLDRKQQVSTLMLCNVQSGDATVIHQERESAWIDILPSWDQDYTNGGWDWINKGKEFLWVSEKDGWRHVYRISRDGKKEQLITKGEYDVMDISVIDEQGNYIYFMTSPQNATQSSLYRTRLDGKGSLERISPATQPGTHDYNIAPGAAYAKHSFSNHKVQPVSEFISLKDHRSITDDQPVADAIAKAASTESRISFFTVKTSEGVTMDAWMARPSHFDSTKKYPVVFYVYTEPWGQTVKDSYGTGFNHLYRGDMVNDGYIYVSIDNRGTPVGKGREWRKSVYRKIGTLNIRDQALAAKEILKLPFTDPERVAVWGWSGGGSATLNLMFQYPEIYKTGISIAAVGNQLTYDNIYQERYMGLPQENREDFVKGSPINYAKNLKGNLLYIHGTGDDNVHYNNAEMLINELIKNNKLFQMMSYPNRSHSISEGPGTFAHLSSLFTDYLKRHCPPGAK